MNIRHLHNVPTSPSWTPTPRRTAPRSGEPWTDEDYRTLMQLCREDQSLEAICDTLERTPGAVQARARKLLPLEERAVPTERILRQLAKNLAADEDYDWEHHLAATPPPRPVVQHVPPPVTLRGIGGLDDDELLLMAASLTLVGATEGNERLTYECRKQVLARRLQDDLTDAVTEQAHELVRRFLSVPSYEPEPWSWPSYGH